MYWEPSQPKYLDLTISGEQPLANTEVPRRKAHRSWKCRWTGPHRIVKCLPGKYNNRYTLHHIKRGDIENIKTDRMYQYEPRSVTHPSTSPEFDDSTTRTRSHKTIGTWCSTNSFFIVSLQNPHPFGVGKVIQTDPDGVVHYQWYEPPSPTDIDGVHLPCWWDGVTEYRTTLSRHT